MMKISVFLMTVAMISHMPTATAKHSRRHHHNCSEPFDLKDQLAALYSNRMHGDLHESFYMVPFLRQVAANQTRGYNFSMEHLKRSAVFSGSDKCPRDMEDFLRKGDPCPVYYTINTDPTRYPRMLLDAQCSCKECQGISVQKRNSNRQKMQPKCEGVYYHLPVLRRLPGCVDRVYRYASAWEKVQVGCACHLIPRVFV